MVLIEFWVIDQEPEVRQVAYISWHIWHYIKFTTLGWQSNITWMTSDYFSLVCLFAQNMTLPCQRTCDTTRLCNGKDSIHMEWPIRDRNVYLIKSTILLITTYHYILVLTHWFHWLPTTNFKTIDWTVSLTYRREYSVSNCQLGYIHVDVLKTYFSWTPQMWQHEKQRKDLL